MLATCVTEPIDMIKVRIQLGQGSAGQVTRTMIKEEGFGSLYKVSKLGFGCMGLTSVKYPGAEEDGISIIKHAFSKGITFFDTSDIYGTDHANEILVGKALKQLPREKVQLASKFGVVSLGPPRVVVNGTPEYVRSCCEASLKRLGVNYIDLYYYHRIDQTERCQ